MNSLTSSNKSDSFIDQIIQSTKELGDQALIKSVEFSRKIEETGIKQKVTTHTSEILNKGLEIGANVYHKTSDKIDQINVS